MEEIRIPKAGAIHGIVRAPPSKSFSHRALIAAALSGGWSRILGPLDSDDTRVTRTSLEALGVPVVRMGDDFHVQGLCGTFRCPKPPVLDIEESGTSLRLLMSVALLCPCPVTFTGGARIRERPVGDLGEALEQLGSRVIYEEIPGFPPVTVSGLPRGGRILVRGDVSSQFVSSLLMSAPVWEEETVVKVTGEPVSASYLDITLDVMKSFGVEVVREGYREFTILPGQQYIPQDYPVEGDYSSASYFFAAAAVTGGCVTVTNLNPVSVQGDRRFVMALEKMGCTVQYGTSQVTVQSDGVLRGLTIDMSSAPDSVPTLCAVAACAKTPSLIHGTRHLKFKESDRVQVMGDMIRSCGGDLSVEEDSIAIRPGPLHGCRIDPCNDHRIAMSAAVLGLQTGDMVIMNPGCVKKSYPRFFSDLMEVCG